jgi:hypothetical protein
MAAAAAADTDPEAADEQHLASLEELRLLRDTNPDAFEACAGCTTGAVVLLTAVGVRTV